VGLGHVRIEGGEAIGTTPRVQSDALALVEDFHGGGAQTDIQDFADQDMRDAVEAFVRLDVVVDTRLGLQPLGILVGLLWQGLEGGSIQVVEQGSTRAREFLKGPLVEIREQFGNDPVER